MALKNFFFRENCIGIEVAGMKMAFSPIFDPTWAPKRPKYRISEAEF